MGERREYGCLAIPEWWSAVTVRHFRKFASQVPLVSEKTKVNSCYAVVSRIKSQVLFPRMSHRILLFGLYLESALSFTHATAVAGPLLGLHIAVLAVLQLQTPPPHPTKTDQFDNGASQHLQHQRPPPHIPPNTSIPPPFFNPVEPPPPYYTMDGSTAAAAMQSSFNHVCN